MSHYLINKQESQRLLFRKAKISDFSDWITFFQNPLTSQYWITKKLDPKTICQQWYEKQFYRYEKNLGGLCAVVEKKTSRLIGHCGLIVQEVDDIKEIEIAYHLLVEFWHNGFAIEAASFCKNYAFENNLTETLISIISTTNTPSEKVAIKNGMIIDKTTQYAKNKVNIYRINQSEWKKSR